MTPVLIVRRRSTDQQAVPFTGDNAADIIAWVRSEGGEAYEAEGHLYIVTDRGDVVAEPSNKIMKGLVGEFYPITDDAYTAGWTLIGVGEGS